jgi:N-acetylmuramoyl-L-alanine amidase
MKNYKYLIITIVSLALIGCSSYQSDSKQAADSNLDNKNVIAEIQNHKPSEENSISNEANKPSTVTDIKIPDLQNTDAEPSKKIVVIDPGHASKANSQKEPNAPGSSVMKIKDGGGATGISSKVPEYHINMEVAQRLKILLEQKDYNVIMTKTDNSISLGNVERAKIGNEAKANLVIRIHCDSNDNSAAAGASILVPQPVNENTKKIYEESKRCGEIVINTLTKQVGMKNRGLIYSKDMTGFNWSDVPVILVEMGFLSNPQEDRLLSSSNYQDKLAKALADGIVEALR